MRISYDGAKKSLVLLSVAEPFSEFLKKRMEVKKNYEPQGKELEKGGSFLSWGGEPQQVYERLRSLALGGGDGTQGMEFALFTKWGMGLFMPESLKGLQGFWTVKRVRALVRAGEFF